MTIWLPDLGKFPGPRYRAIAEALAADIAGGALPPGKRLPTHRDLAWRLGVTVGTVSRAYAEAERRGLVTGEVGRGTYVRAPDKAIAPGPAWDHAEASDFVDFSFNIPAGGGEAAAFAATLSRLAASPALGDLLHYRSSRERQADCTAGAAWVGRSRLPATAAQIVLTNGGQHGVATILSVLTRPGDAVAVECLTYPGFRALADLLGLRLLGLAMDEDGLLPEAFEAACRERPLKALYTMPTLQNPLAIVMPEARRRAIAEIAGRYDVPIVEDDVLGFLVAEPPPPLSVFAPAHAFYVTSTSKSMAPGLRIGYVHAPAAWVGRLHAALRATTYMAAPLDAAVVSSVDRRRHGRPLRRGQAAAAEARARLVAELLPPGALRRHRDASHLLMSPPSYWRAEEFAGAARRRGVGVTPLAAFTVDRRRPRLARPTRAALLRHAVERGGGSTAASASWPSCSPSAASRPISR